MNLARRLTLACVSLLLGAGIWLSCVHLLFCPDPEQFLSDSAIPPKAHKLAARHVELWTADSTESGLADELVRMRAATPEWDLMARSYLVWSLANMALRDAAFKPTALAAADRVIDQTLRLEREQGPYCFLMPYARSRAWVRQPPRSQFVDSQLALMLALRRLVEEREDYQPLLADRVRLMIEEMERRPVLSAESYPDECWTFCNTVALAAIRVHDYLDGTDHGEFIRRWIATARTRLIDPRTGMLVSAYRVDGQRIYGPEGSSIWMVSHCLSLVDEPFARRQYELARKFLGRQVLGFGYSREWPTRGGEGRDVDSGLVVPGLDLSVGASGMALLGAATFGDRDFYVSLVRSLQLAGFPVESSSHLRYGISNQVGDAVVLYSMTLGPAWREVSKRDSSRLEHRIVREGRR